ncbi:hypothetical protein BDY21DRAFT_215435 [Lineolata rhizophorae]|uniref:Uncharacterized protein n=1 Tax=Lineolata rhizophorae TaxID=578093 RepID=A0A6A6P424_9PEZI|nr:hypothetical protein BDY21DRAFT_215435 [Lineolata rhizophorae]
MAAEHSGTAPAGALTDIFTMPSYCNGITTPFWTFACMPPNYSSVYWFGPEAGYYSPGICPSGYTSACTRPPDSSGIEYGPPVIAGETAHICCPVGYECDESWYSMCTLSPTGFESTTSAYGIQVRWQESDLAALETDPTDPATTYDFFTPTGVTPSTTSTSFFTTTTSTSTSSPTTTSGPSVPPIPTSSTTGSGGGSSGSSSDDDDDDSGSGLATGAKIGIGVAVPVAVLAITSALLWFFFIHRKKNAKSPEHEPMQPSMYAQQPPTTPGYPPPPGVPGAAMMSPNDKMPMMTTAGPLDYSQQQQQPYPMGYGPPPPQQPYPINTGMYGSGAPVGPSPGTPGAYQQGAYAPPPPPPESQPRGSVAEGAAAAGPPPGVDPQVWAIQQEQTRLAERRARLQQMAELDDEEERLRDRMRELEGRGG